MAYDLDPKEAKKCPGCHERPRLQYLEKRLVAGTWVRLDKVRLWCCCVRKTHWHSTEKMAMVYWNDGCDKLTKKLAKPKC